MALPPGTGSANVGHMKAKHRGGSPGVGERRAALGRRGERLAADYLERAGMMIVERNYRCRVGEVDLIALDGDTIVFVEVKLRRGDFEPSEAVDARKQGHIARAAFDFMLRRGLMTSPARFDVVAICMTGPSNWQCHHLADAFDTPIEY